VIAMGISRIKKYATVIKKLASTRT